VDDVSASFTVAEDLNITTGVSVTLSVMPNGGTTVNYTLQSINLHAQAEHTIDNKRNDAEL
jgi:carbonic anhydrase